MSKNLVWQGHERSEIEDLVSKDSDKIFYLGSVASDNRRLTEDIDRLEDSVDGLLNLFEIQPDVWQAHALKAWCRERTVAKEEIQATPTALSVGRYLYNLTFDSIGFGDDLHGNGESRLTVALSDAMVAQFHGFGDHWGDAIYGDPDNPGKTLHAVIDKNRLRDLEKSRGRRVLEDNYLDYERDYKLDFQVSLLPAKLYESIYAQYD